VRRGMEQVHPVVTSWAEFDVSDTDTCLEKVVSRLIDLFFGASTQASGFVEGSTGSFPLWAEITVDEESLGHDLRFNLTESKPRFERTANALRQLVTPQRVVYLGPPRELRLPEV
jgi:hypothetical protein